MENGQIEKIDLFEKINNKVNNYVVYLLTNTCHNKTYVGITNNPLRRLRQHNGELAGGARYTTSNKQTGEWKFYGHVTNLNKSMALSIEKKIKIRSKKKSGTPVERRLLAIKEILEELNDESIKWILY